MIILFSSQADESFMILIFAALQVPENCAILVNIHEPIIWRLHEMFQQAKSSRIFGSPTNAVSVDPTIQIGYNFFILYHDSSFLFLFTKF